MGVTEITLSAVRDGVPRGGRAQPGSRRLLFVAVLLWLAMTPPLVLFYASIPPNPDQALFDYIGWISWQGGSYYSDAFEINWPAVFFVH